MINIKKIKPLFTTIITTGNKFDKDVYEKGIITSKKGDLKMWQTVLAIGESVRGIEVGDTVMIDSTHFAVRKYDPNSVRNDMGMNKITGYVFDWVTVEGKECLKIDNRDVLFVCEVEEVEESPILQPDKKIITN